MGRTRTRRMGSALLAGLVVVALSGCLKPNVERFSSDPLRTNDLGSAQLLKEVVNRFQSLGVGPVTTNPPGYRQYMQSGSLALTNVYVVIPGTDPDLADEYVVVGADARVSRSQSDCPHPVGDDDVCNGATESGTGVAAALEVARRFSAAPAKRSVLVAVWWNGASYMYSSPFIDTSKIVGYVDLGTLGSNLRPALRSSTYASGAETGGAALASAVSAAAGQAPGLTVRRLSWNLGDYFGQQTSFRNHGVPTVYLDDTPGPCYRTVDDEAGIVDFEKLEAQTTMATALARDLGDRAVPPAFVAPAPGFVTYPDAVTLDEVATLVGQDIDLTPTDQRPKLAAAQATLSGVVAGGPAGFDGADALATAGAGIDLSPVARSATCDGYLD